MIFVTLGTQDKDFSRLLKAIDEEIKRGNIKEKVVVQAGYTKYSSENMEIFDLIPTDEFNELIEKSSVVITHGGVGNILSAIKKDNNLIKRVVVGELETNCYLLIKDNNCLVIDPGDEYKKIVNEIDNLSCKGILLTHHHFDHVGALKDLEDRFNLKHNSEYIEGFNYNVIILLFIVSRTLLIDI